MKPINSSNEDYWKALDWSKSNADLTLLTGRSPSTIAAWRRRLKAQPTTGTGPRRREQMHLRKLEWSSWDWTQQDAKLAREHRCSREGIRQLRKKLGKPASPHKWERKQRSRFGSIMLNAPEFSNLRGTEIAKKLQCSTATVYKLAHKQGFRFHRGFGNPPHVNWRLSDRDLADIWDLKYNTVRQTRCRKQRGSADKTDPERYQQWLEEEQLKAKQFRHTHQAEAPTNNPQPIQCAARQHEPT